MKVYIAQIHTLEVSIGHRREFRNVIGAFADYQTARSVCLEELDAFMNTHGISPRLSAVEQREDSFECSVDFNGQACVCDFFATELMGKQQRHYDEMEELPLEMDWEE